jgi:hypothetical protein
MNKLWKGLWLVACVIGMLVVQSDTASAATCGPNQVYSSSMGQCIPKAAMCGRNQVYSSSMEQCIPKVAGCAWNQVYVSSLGQCIPKNAGGDTKVFFPHGCPYNLDKVCIKTQGGVLVQCHCVS